MLQGTDKIIVESLKKRLLHLDFNTREEYYKKLTSWYVHLQEHLPLEIVVRVDIPVGRFGNFPLGLGENVFGRRVGQNQPLHPGKVFTEVGEALFHPLLQSQHACSTVHQNKSKYIKSHTETSYKNCSVTTD